MSILLTADLHLTDKDEDLYRWDVFVHILEWAKANKGGTVIIAGDLCDRKDRHSSVLVNMLIDVLQEIRDAATITIYVMKGNHDEPLNGPPYWRSLSAVPGIVFVEKPTFVKGRLLLLPFAEDPKEDWAGQNLSTARAIIMHQTVTGVMGNNGHQLVNDKMPQLPDIPIYSGDIHNPQIVVLENGATVRYIGAPHHVKFGDAYQPRYIVLNDNFEQIIIQNLYPPSKHMIEAYSIDEIRRRDTKPGDMACVRYFMHAKEIGNWPAILEGIKDWATRFEITLARVEPVLDGVAPVAPTEAPDDLLTTPQAILNAFFDEENVPIELRNVGTQLLQDVINARAVSS